MIRTVTLAMAVATILVGGFTLTLLRAGDAGTSEPARITSIEKNQVWPLAGFITMEPCAADACQEV